MEIINVRGRHKYRDTSTSVCVYINGLALQQLIYTYSGQTDCLHMSTWISHAHMYVHMQARVSVQTDTLFCRHIWHHLGSHPQFAISVPSRDDTRRGHEFVCVLRRPRERPEVCACSFSVCASNQVLKSILMVVYCAIKGQCVFACMCLQQRESTLLQQCDNYN